MKIGKYSIENGIFLAPMENITDFPFRMICKKLGADVMYSEFISSEALIRDADKAFKKLTFKPEERPIGIQIYGNRVEAMVAAAQIAEEKEPDFIDINFGCPVKKVALKGSGAGLLRDIPLMLKITESVVKHSSIPVTAKTRIGWDADTINIIEIAQELESVGIEALTVHARTRAQGFKGSADWDWIKKVKESVTIPVIGNGDIVHPEQVKEMFDLTGCDAVMIGRGAINNPWIFKHAKEYLKKGIVNEEISLAEKIDLLISHLKYSVEYKGEKRALLEIRKYYSGYLKGLPYIAKFRNELMQHTKMEAIIDQLNKLKENYQHSPIKGLT